MENNEYVRRWDSDVAYREEIEETVGNNFAVVAMRNANQTCANPGGLEFTRDPDKLTAIAVYREMVNRPTLLDNTEESEEALLDVLTETIRQGYTIATQGTYEALAPVEVPQPVGDLVELEKFWKHAPLTVPGTLDLFVKVRDGQMSADEAIQQLQPVRSSPVFKEVVMEVNHYYDAADKWANKPGLTVLEACHGVANDTYGLRFNPVVPRPLVGPDFNSTETYSEIYNIQLHKEIESRQIRAAKELFHP